MIDNLIVLSYLILILFIGVYYRSKSGNFKSFASVKDSTRKNKLLLVATIFVASVGGGTTFGIAEKSFSGNLAYTYALILTIPIDLLVAKYIVPKLSKHYGAQSVGDIMEPYYGYAGRLLAGIAAIIISIGLVAAQISVSGRIFQYILKTDYLYGVILSYSIVITYTTIGGLRAVMFTNFLQFFSMLIAIPVITIAGINVIGFENFIESFPYDKAFFNSKNNLLKDTIIATLGFAVMGMYPNFIQRTLINNDHGATTRAIYYKTAIFAVFLLFITLNGLIAYQLYPVQAPSLVLPYLIDQIIPVGLKGLVVVGLLAAVMSTADSDLNVTSISLVKDLFSPIFKEHDQQKLLYIARITNIIMGSSAIMVALTFTNIVDLVVFSAGFWAPMILVPLIFALFDITISKTMMIISSIGGVSSFLSWEYCFACDYDLKGVFVGTLVSLTVFLSAHAFTKGSGKTIKDHVN